MVLLFSYALAQPAQCQEKSFMAGLELTSFLRGSAEACIRYSFAKHWSVSGEASISYNGLTRRKSSIEQEHDGEFTSPVPLSKDPDMHCERILFSCWPTESFKGFSLSAGVQSGSSTGMDIITEAAYTVEIWKGLSLSTGIRIPVLAGIRNGKISAENIRAGINYRF